MAGAAHATSISALAATLVALWRLSLRRVRLSRSPKPDVKTIKQITRVGGPIGVSGTIFTLIYVILGRQLSALQGGAALAALAVGHRIEAVSYTITEGYAVGVAQWWASGAAPGMRSERPSPRSRPAVRRPVHGAYRSSRCVRGQQLPPLRRTPQYHKPPRTTCGPWHGASLLRRRVF